MAESKKYYEQIKVDITEKLDVIILELPRFCKRFFLAMEGTDAPQTLLGYAYDLRIFFHFIKENNPVYKDMDIRDIKFEVLEQLGSSDFEEYLHYLRHYVKDGVEYNNSEQGVKRKFCAVRSLYSYFYSCKEIETNPTLLVKMPKLREKNIIRLEEDEVSDLLDKVESGAGLTKKQLESHEKNKIRDTAIVTLLLGTGIRVSECVGLDLKDVDFNHHAIKIMRKGGKEGIVYIGDEVEDSLQQYLLQRQDIIPKEGHENAMFLSSRNSRITVRSVELLVNKYASLVTTVKHITPHKLRSTYGTNLYRNTSDIYLVADVLGHKDVNTTKKHYSAIDEDIKKNARNQVNLKRKED